MQDPYEVLGVANSATQKEIKKAFHKLALANHPDRATADKKSSSLEKMKEINAAYGIIGDESSRAQYDAKNRGKFKTENKRRKTYSKNTYCDGFNFNKTEDYKDLNNWNFDNFGSQFFQKNITKRKFESMFNNEEFKNKFVKASCSMDFKNFFKNLGFGTYKNKKDPLIFKLKLSLNDIYTGTKRTIKIRRNYFFIPEENFINVVIEPGTPHGHTIKFSDAGEIDLDSSQDLHIVIEVEVDPFFHRKEENLFCSSLIAISDVNKDFKIMLKLPGNRNVRLKRSDFTRIGENTLFPSLGMPVFGNPLKNGDLYVKLIMDLKDTGISYK